MLFNRKGKFFLNLDGNTDRANSEVPEATQQDSDQVTEQAKVPITVVAESAVAEKMVTTADVTGASISSPKASAQQDNGADSVVTETVRPVAPSASIATDLEIAEDQRPTVSYTTFAPDYLLPGSGLRRRNRRPGAALKDFRGIAQDLFKS